MPNEKTVASPLELGKGIAVKTGQAQQVQIANAKPTDAPQPASTSGTPGPRPSFGSEKAMASAPSVLDFEQTDVILANLPENEFRDWIVKVQGRLADLGLNRGNNADDYARLNPRAEAYLDIVTWDPNTRAGYKDSSMQQQSSCGMFIRDLWWLCGVRGGSLMDNKYKGSGIILDLLHYAPGLRITTDPETDPKKHIKGNWSTDSFVPKPGDVLYLYQEKTNPTTGKKFGSNHIFSIMTIDRNIALEDGKAMIRDKVTGEPAQTITFTSVDGGQADGAGQDSKHQMHDKAHEADGRGAWGCHATKACTRTMKLKDGRWPNVIQSWPFPEAGKEAGRPIAAWIPIASMQAQFTAPLILPIRNSSPTPSGSPASGGAAAAGQAGTHADASDPKAKRKEWDDFVERNQAKGMGDLLNILASAGYREVLGMRDWYASPENPKREIFGLRPRAAMDAILHKNEGESARWILNECELAGISAAHCSDQYALIKKTIGITSDGAGGASGNIA